MTIRYRTSPSLKHFDYIGPYAYFLTLVTRARHRAFTSRASVDIAEAALEESLTKHHFALHAYCFMPDHVHLLVAGDPTSDLRGFVHHFKTLTGFTYKKPTGRPLWQISYHDRTLRRDEDLHDVAVYIWQNPVRARLAPNAASYPFSGPRPLAERL